MIANMAAAWLKLFCICLLYQAAKSCADGGTGPRSTHLWQIKQHNRPPVYLFGSIHMPWQKIWPNVSRHVHNAFLVANTVFLELLINEKTAQVLTSCRDLPSNKTLDLFIGRKLFRKIDKFLTKRMKTLSDQAFGNRPGVGKNMQMFAQFYQSTANWQIRKPAWILIMLLNLIKIEEKHDSAILDAFLAQEALRQKKQVFALETVEEQCSPLSDLSNNEIALAIRLTLDHLIKQSLLPADAPSSNVDILKEYECGNLSDNIFETTSFLKVAPPGEKLTLQEKIQNSIVDRRNSIIARRLTDYLLKSSTDVVFVVVGEAHFLGNNSVIAQLKILNRAMDIKPIDDDILDIVDVSPFSTSNIRNMWQRGKEKNHGSAIQSDYKLWTSEYPIEVFEPSSAVKAILPFPVIFLISSVAMFIVTCY